MYTFRDSIIILTMNFKTNPSIHKKQTAPLTNSETNYEINNY